MKKTKIEADIFSSVTTDITRLKMYLGFNPDGSKSGNGIIGLTGKLENKIEKLEKYISKLSVKFDEANKNIEFLMNEIKEIKLGLKDNITIRSLVKVQKITIGIFSFITAIIGIFAYIIYLSSNFK